MVNSFCSCLRLFDAIDALHVTDITKGSMPFSLKSEGELYIYNKRYIMHDLYSVYVMEAFITLKQKRLSINTRVHFLACY